MLSYVPVGVVYSKFQQVPHRGEFQVAFGIPPILGKDGREPKVVKPFVNRPLAPLEQATFEREVALDIGQAL